MIKNVSYFEKGPFTQPKSKQQNLNLKFAVKAIRVPLQQTQSWMVHQNVHHHEIQERRISKMPRRSKMAEMQGIQRALERSQSTSERCGGTHLRAKNKYCFIGYATGLQTFRLCFQENAGWGTSTFFENSHLVRSRLYMTLSPHALPPPSPLSPARFRQGLQYYA